MNTTSPVMTGTDELIEQLEALTCIDEGGAVLIHTDQVRCLLTELRRLRAENAELAKDAGRWNYYAPTVAMMSGVSMKKMNEVIDDAMQTAMATQ